MSLIWLVLGYLAGSIPTGYLLAKRLKGVDIRKTGSGNVGATNAGRVLGKEWAIIIAVFDMLKGGIIVLIASRFTSSAVTLALTGAMAVVGHSYPVWLNFKGGKGVATTFGVFAFFDFFTPYPALLGGLVWYLTLKKTKYVSAASMVSLFAAAFLMPIFNMPRSYYVVALLLSALVTWRHKSNIVRILNGEEARTN